MPVHKLTTEELVAKKPPIKNFRAKKRRPIVFILHNLRSLENVGLFFRLADAFLVEKIYLTGYTGYPRLKSDSREERIISHAEKEINKTAIKLVPYVPWEHRNSGMDVVTELKERGYQILSVEQTTTSIDYQSPIYHPPLALIFGHERTGVEEDLLLASDAIVNIPMLGMGNSHNVAMAGAIIISHLIH